MRTNSLVLIIEFLPLISALSGDIFLLLKIKRAENWYFQQTFLKLSFFLFFKVFVVRVEIFRTNQILQVIRMLSFLEGGSALSLSCLESQQEIGFFFILSAKVNKFIF